MARVASLAAEVTADIGPLKTQMRQAGQSVNDFTRRARTSSQQFDRSMQTATRSSGAFGRGVQNAAFQVGDFAVQVGGGTSAVRAMSMQLPQLLGGFGVMGAVLGATVAILGPFAQHLFDSADGASQAEDAISGLSGSLEGVRGSVRQLGDLQQRLNDLHRAQAGASASGATAVIANTQKEFDARKQLIEVERTLLRLRSQDAIQALNNLRSQQEMARQAAQERLRNIGPGATGTRASDAEGFAGPGPSMADIETAIGSDTLEQMRERSRQIQQLEAELALVEIAADEATQALDGVFEGSEATGGGAAGGGGGGTSRRVQQIREMTQETKTQLDMQLDAWSGFFGDLEGIMREGGGRAVKIAKLFGAAQALIATYTGAAEALKLPFPANLAAYAKVLATGFSAVSAIKGVNAGGGGGAAGGGAAPAAPSFSQAVAITLEGSESATFSKSQVRDLINQINEAVEGGAIVRLA